MRKARFVFARAVVFAAIALLLAAPSAFGAEGLLFVKPDGWHEIYTGREGALSTTEYVPELQNAENWREMLTVQILLEEADADPDKLLSNVVRHLAEACPALEMQPIDLGGTSDDYDSGTVMLACGEQPETGHGDFSILRGIAGKENFYLLQKSWRLDAYDVKGDPPVSLEARKFWLSYLAYLSVCDPATGPCPAQLKDAR